ncbi:WD40-repeat-containing domain protein [Cokeromyces recurvatus]|uniref:WD40-repeat-containing domain protein n=1 Tax=Cokeromyces recurvatus TaxID=90255 RepID=UPI0022207541|nr:WD40-repeat-containing domain protein [Cokeromyces recurvatus]KAI7901369.1 WD40-repeat-containing domain protein [Cokeromyces recurvatus]
MSELSSTMEYTLPGVLHFLQVEWRKFEREKNEWAIERAELKARIALLEGERRGMENVRLVLMKRVKMLEYALRQERKRHDGITMTTTTTLEDQPNVKATSSSSTVDNKLKEKSRQVLKSCLQEINYLTSIPSRLPLTNALATRTTAVGKTSTMDNSHDTDPPATGTRSQRNNKQLTVKKQNSYFSNPVQKKPIIDPLKDDLDMEVPANVDEVAMINNIKEEKEQYSASQDNESLSMQIQEKFHLSEEKVMKLMKHANKNDRNKLQHNEHLLAGDFDPNQIGDINEQQQNQPKIWKPRITIKGHLDSVRAVCFHPKEMIAASGSDDGTVKIWNLQRATGKDGIAPKKGALEEADPCITFRGHTNAVTGVLISELQNKVYSASLDSTIRVWKLPAEDHGLFSPVDPSLNMATYIGHTDAIWDFKFSSTKYQKTLLASASADGTIKIWDTESTGSLLKSSLTFDGILTEDTELNKVAPTSLDYCHTDINKLVVSFVNAKIRLYDIETGQVIMTFKGSDDTYDNTVNTQINKIIAYPTMPMIVTGHEDRYIKFFDIRSGECTETVSGHLDAVTSLDIDSTSTHMVSGGHDSSIRLWDLSKKTCVQEFSAHRRKGDEGVLNVKFHPTYPWLISGGADGIVKIYHHGY